jgi:ABC-type transport system substrate-binding protein
MRRLASGVLIVWLLVVVAACAGDGDDEATSDTNGEGSAATDGPGGTDAERTPEPGGVLRIGLVGDMPGWNPAQDQFTLSGYQVAAAVYDVLVRYDAEGVARPYLAESIEPNADFTVWTFTLRPGITFHDGTPLDAEVLALNFEQTKASPLLGQVFQAVESVEVVDDLTVRVNMSTPWASFPHTLTAQPGLVVAPSVFEDPRTPVGTGPFVFVSQEEGSELVVTKNEDYWREGYPLLDGIEFRVLTDSRSRADTLKSGDVDMIEIREAGEIVSFEEDEEFVLYLDTYGETTESIMMLNTAVPPFDNPDARAAVNYGVDRQGIADTVHAGRYEVANGPFEEDSPWYQGVEFPSYDPDAAAEAAAAYEAATGEPISFSVLITPEPVAQQIATLLDQQMAEIGVEVDIVTQDGTQAILSVLGGDFDMTLTNALFGSGHPDREYTFIVGSNALPPGQLATNFTRITNDDVDQGLDAARVTDDLEEQSAAWGQVQEGLADEMAFIFVTHNELGDAASPAVQDLLAWTLPSGEPGMPQDQNVVSLYQVWLDQ